MKNASLRATLVCVALLCPGSLTAQTRPRNVPQVRTTLLNAHVEILDGVATTTLKQTIRNDGHRPAEAVWLLPLPPGAVADEFRMTVDGVEMTGDVLRSDEARGVYESIVRRRRDPGLLEYAGRGCLRARVFPIPPRGEVLVEAGFRQVLPFNGGLHHWSFALAAAGVGGRAPEQVALDLSVRSKRSIKTVYSPAGNVHVIHKGDHEARASYESVSGVAKQLDVFYGLSEKEFGLDLLTTRAAGAEEGTFLMLITPKQEWGDEKIHEKAITFVVDTSASMHGAKLDQAREALRFFLSSLDPRDRFNVVPFSTESEPFFSEPVLATPEHMEVALGRANTLSASGGTNIDDALERGLVFGADEPQRVPIVVFLTDGHPTVGETKAQRILVQARERNVHGARIFVFGVGADVNTHLLDTLAAESGGARDYVREDEDIEVKTSALFTKLSHPVMTDLELAVEGVRLTRVVPAVLPDLFRGSRIQVTGRYVGTGPQAIRLKGSVRGEPYEYVYESAFAAAPVAAHEFLPSLWAERRVGVLLDAIRLNGHAAELVDEVRRLGTEYHIVTPYTSHLIVEEGLRVAAGPGAGRYRGPGDTAPPGRRSGGPATAGGSGPTSLGARAPLTPGAAQTGADGFFLGRGAKAPGSPRAPSLKEIVERLRAAGVLPADAPAEELEELAVQIVRELTATREGLRGLGEESTGKDAVRASRYLSGLMSGRPDSQPASLLSLFTRKVKDKVFVLRRGVWTDRTFDETSTKPRRTVEAFSEPYFALLRAKPELGAYFAFSPRMVVVLDDGIYQVTPPKEDEE